MTIPNKFGNTLGLIKLFPFYCLVCRKYFEPAAVFSRKTVFGERHKYSSGRNWIRAKRRLNIYFHLSDGQKLDSK